MKCEAIIGLEIHIQSKTESKMFCGCATDYFGDPPNTHTCPVCLGLPGALPVPNKRALEKCLILSLALNCQINKSTKFDRKNYFYPDLVKGYQISQYDLPLGYDGKIKVLTEKGESEIRITRIHQEEDTGKSIHSGEQTLLDFNKSGMPLIEVVTEPDFRTAEEVTAFAKQLRQIVRYLDVSDADMEKGQMRFEINMSLRAVGSKELPEYKVEVKNIGSISVLEKVIAYEFIRQQKLLEAGDIPPQETRGVKDMSGVTLSQRSKEEAADYRYFPEPDIPPIEISEEWLDSLREQMGDLPTEKKNRYIKDYQVEEYAAEVILANREWAEWFDQVIEEASSPAVVAESAKWLIGDIAGFLNEKEAVDLSELVFTPAQLAEFAQLVCSEKITSTVAKQVMTQLLKKGGSPAQIVAKMDIKEFSEEDLRSLADQVITENPKIVEDYQSNPNAVKALVGLIMKQTKGQADPLLARQILEEKLSL